MTTKLKLYAYGMNGPSHRKEEFLGWVSNLCLCLEHEHSSEGPNYYRPIPFKEFAGFVKEDYQRLMGEDCPREIELSFEISPFEDGENPFRLSPEQQQEIRIACGIS